MSEDLKHLEKYFTLKHATKSYYSPFISLSPSYCFFLFSVASLSTLQHLC